MGRIALTFAVALPVMAFVLAGSVGMVAAHDGPATAGGETAAVGGGIYLWAGIAQAAATVVAVALGGVFAWRQGIIFRQGKPHISIVHSITHRQISPQYAHLEVEVALHNSSRVKVEIRDGLFNIEQLSPMTDVEVDGIFAKAFADGKVEQYQPPAWGLLYEGLLEWAEGSLIIEPGQTAVETYEYILAGYIGAVLVSTHFCNIQVMGKVPVDVNPRNAEMKRKGGFWRKARFWQTAGAPGWTKTTVHDIVAATQPDTSGGDDVAV